MADKTEEVINWFPERFKQIGNHTWCNGQGASGGLMVVCDYPDGIEVAGKKAYTSHRANTLRGCMKDAGVNLRRVYWTYLVKYPTKLKPKAVDIKLCTNMLQEEIEKVQPQLIILPGSFVVSGVLGTKYPISRCRGDIIEVEGRKYLPVYDMAQVDKTPELKSSYVRDLTLAANALNGDWYKPPQLDVQVIHTAEEVRSLHKSLTERHVRLLALDCEWDGKNWLDPDRYFRTIQVAWSNREAACIEIATEGGKRCSSEAEVLKAVKELLESGFGILGQNVIADGEWLLSYGIDIRPNVVFDTMLAEYIIHSDLPVGLEELSMRYTGFGRYSTAVELWTHQNARLCRTGYGNVPRDMLMAYAGYDVCVLFDIMAAQLPILRDRGYLRPRGVHSEYPSLYGTTLRTQEIIYELELNGLPVDYDRLVELIGTYQQKKAELLALITSEAAAVGLPSFNPNSTADKRALLYDKLGITPVRTTDGRDWAEAVGNVGLDYDEEISAGTDKNTLAILSAKNPVARHLIWYNAINQACKTWLKFPDETGDGGLIADMWSDSKLHPHLSQLTQTGRLRSSSPNAQNWPKRAEGVTLEVFGKDHHPPSLRTIVKPPKGYVMIEGDFCQAELFTLANLSGDPNMLKILNTPGMDLHDKSAVDGFGFRMEDEDGNAITLDDLVRVAAEEPEGENSERFQHLQKTLVYIDAHGKRYTRSEFKSGPRIAAKAVSFSVPYGISAQGLGYQVKSQTGDQRDLSVVVSEVAKLIDSWKTTTFPVAWQHLVSWQQRVYNPGWIENPWGRRKWLTTNPGRRNTALEREAGNFPGLTGKRNRVNSGKPVFSLHHVTCGVDW